MLDLDNKAIALLSPSILNQNIVIRDPKLPFDKLPRLPQLKSDKASLNPSWSDDNNNSGFDTNVHSQGTPSVT